MRIVDELDEFLRLQMKNPETILWEDESVSAILMDDDQSLINRLLVAETSAVTLEQLSALVDALPRHEALRTALVMPDDTPVRRQEQLRREGARIFQQLSTFSTYLDNHLRPARVCDKLLQSGEDAPNAREGLLFEDDFIEPHAMSQVVGKVDAMQHLVGNWSRGLSPRVGVILAPAGYGKSKLTHILAKRLAKVYSEKATASPPLPYLIPFGDYRGTSTFDGLVQVAQAEHGNPLLTPGGFRFLVSRGRALLILDGYDEMLDKFAEKAKSNIGAFISQAGPSSRVILTARTLFYRSSGEVVGMVGDPNFTTADVELLELQPFNRAKALEYLRIKLDKAGDKAQTVERAQKLLERVDGGLGIYGSPFFLSEFVGQVRSSTNFTISGIGANGFLDYLVGISFQRERTRQGHDFTDAEQQAFLENIALDMLQSERSAAYDTEDLELFALEAMSSERADSDDRASLLFAHHFLDPVDEYASFQHQVWRDYFQGKALARAIAGERKEAVTVLNRRELPDGVVRNCVSAGSRTELAVRLGDVTVRTNDVGMRNVMRLISEIASLQDDRYRIPASVAERLPARSLNDLYLENLDFSGVDLRGCVFTGTYFKDCDLQGVRWQGAFLSSTTFLNCQVDSGIAAADHASSVIDGEELFGPQLREHVGYSATEDAAASESVESAPETLEEYATRILAGRLRRFLKGGVFDSSIDWVAFMGGLPRSDHDFVVKSLVRALKAEDILVEDKGIGGSRPPFILNRDSDVRRDVAALTASGEVGASLRPVIDRLLKRRA